MAQLIGYLPSLHGVDLWLHPWNCLKKPEAGGSDIQYHSCLFNKFEVSLEGMRFYIKEISGNKTESYADNDKHWMCRNKV